MSSSPASSAPKPARPIPDGTVLGGRFRATAHLGEVEGAQIHTAEDLTFPGRQALMVRIPSLTPEAAAEALGAFDGPAAAAPLALVPVESGAACAFSLAHGATPLEQATGLAREQRAALLVSLARAVEDGSGGHVAARLVTPATLWVEGGPHAPSLKLVPVPVATLSAEEAHADDLRAFAFLLGAQLFGVDAESWTERTLDALPGDIRALIEPLLDADRGARLAAGLSADVLERTLGVTPTSSRVPVPRASAPGPAAQARIANAQTAARRRSARELGLAVSALLIGAIIASVVFYQRGALAPRDADESAIESATPEKIPPSDGARLEGGPPAPRDVTPSPESVARASEQAAVFHALDTDRIDPRGLGPRDAVEQTPAWLPHVRFFVDATGRVERVDHYRAARQFDGYSTYEYDAQGRVMRVERYTSTGAIKEREELDWETMTATVTQRDGTVAIPGCPAIRFALDASGRLSERACIDADGELATFPEGHAREVFEYRADGADARVRIRRTYDREGAPVATSDGHAVEHQRRDHDGHIIERRFFGPEDNPGISLELGAHMARYENVRRHEGAPATILRRFDADDRPTPSPTGVHEEITRFNARGGLYAFETRDLAGALVEPTGSVTARTEYETSAPREHIAITRFHGADGAPAERTTGLHRIETARDAHGNVLRECHFSAIGPLPSPELSGAHCVVRERDRAGLLIRESWWGTDGQPVTDDVANIHAIRIERDDRGRQVAEWYEGTDGSSATAWAGYAGVRSRYDKAGALAASEYVDADGRPFQSVTGFAEMRWERDGRGRETSRCFHDLDGEPSPILSGFAAGAACIHTEYDDRGRVRWLRYADAEGEPVLARFQDPLAAAAIFFDYGPNGRLLRQELLNVEGQVDYERHCTRPDMCIGPSGWSWYVP
jgi:hypothetical protein